MAIYKTKIDIEALVFLLRMSINTTILSRDGSSIVKKNSRTGA